MTTEQFNKAQELQEHIQNLREVQKFITSVSGECKLAIQFGRKCFPINEPGIQDKVRDYINQRITELEEEFKAL